MVMALPTVSPFTCTWMVVPGSAAPLIITAPVATVPASNPKGSMTNGVAVILSVVVSVAVVNVLAAVFVTPALVGVNVAVMRSVAFTPSTTATVGVWVTMALVAVGVGGVVVTRTTGVSIAGSAVNWATTPDGAISPRSRVIRSPPWAEEKKAKRSPNQPKPAPPRITKKRMATNGKSSMVNRRR